MVGEPAAHVQVLRTKGRRDRIHSVFQLPDRQGSRGKLAGTYRSQCLSGYRMEFLLFVLLAWGGHAYIQNNKRRSVELLRSQLFLLALSKGENASNANLFVLTACGRLANGPEFDLATAQNSAQSAAKLFYGGSALNMISEAYKKGLHPRGSFLDIQIIRLFYQNTSVRDAAYDIENRTAASSGLDHVYLLSDEMSAFAAYYVLSEFQSEKAIIDIFKLLNDDALIFDHIGSHLEHYNKFCDSRIEGDNPETIRSGIIYFLTKKVVEIETDEFIRESVIFNHKVSTGLRLSGDDVDREVIRLKRHCDENPEHGLIWRTMMVHMLSEAEFRRLHRKSFDEFAASGSGAAGL